MRPIRETTSVRYLELEPSLPLRRYVRCYWFLTGTGRSDDIGAEPALPDGSPELILNLAEPFQAIAIDGGSRLQPVTILVGQITGPFAVAPTGRIDLVAARLEPFGAVGLCDHMAGLTDRWADGEDLAAARLSNLREALLTSGAAETRAAILDRHLGPVFAEAKQPDPRVESAVRAIRTSHGACSLEVLSRNLGTTPRSLQRLFAAEVGISPKLLARITRFQRVFSAWRADPASLARVAAECGYFDQSHLIRDFRDFAGAAPAAFLASPPEFTAFFTANPRPLR